MGDTNRDRDTVRETERTTIIHDTGDRGGGGGGIIAAVILLLVVVAVLFFFFRGSFNRAANDVGVNVNVPAAKVELPDVNIKVPEKVTLPDVNVKTEKSAPTNQSQ